VVEELREFIETCGKFPSSQELRRKSRFDLNHAIQSLGGFNHFRAIFGNELQQKPTGYWKEWANVESELRKNFTGKIREGICPDSYAIKAAGFSGALQYFGLSEVARRLKCKLASCWQTRDGHIVSSFYEYILDEYLLSIGVSHVPNTRFHPDPKRKFTCDQKIDKLYIEIWGYGKNDKSSRAERYQRKRKKKESIYRDLDLELVSIEKEFFLRSYPEIEKGLDSLFSGHGFEIIRKHPFCINTLAQHGGFVPTKERIIEKLQLVVDEIGEFPTMKRLVECGRGALSGQVQKTGGQNYYRRLMGFSPPVRPNNYWSLEQTLATLKERSAELGRLPKQKEMKEGLANAVDKHGGINCLAQELGLTSKKKPNGWWTDERVVLDALCDDVVPVLGHFPTARELEGIGRSDLANAISRSGGYRYYRKQWERLKDRR